MKTKITLSLAEAQDCLANHMADNLPYSNNEVEVEILPPASDAPTDNLPLNRASKIALIKFARTLAEDYRHGRLGMSNRETIGPRVGEPYFGLADAKAYVENYLKANSPSV
jgi:hypothetical protein